MVLTILIICAVILTGICIYALLKAASDADDITETLQEHIRQKQQQK